MEKPIEILNLYAGIGGNRKFWDGNVHVTAVEINPEIADLYQKLYPNDTVIIGDAHAYLLENFRKLDFIWSSPPCQKHSALKKLSIKRGQVDPQYFDASLWQEIVLLQNFAPQKCKWVIENVKPYYTPLIPPNAKLDRHLFWSNFRISPLNHENIANFVDAKYDDLMKWLGFDFEEKIYMVENHYPGQILRNCVHPKVGNHIFKCAMGVLNFYKNQQMEIDYIIENK